MTPWAAKCAACWLEPHWRSTVVAGTDSGHPAASTALRATLTRLLAHLRHAAHHHVVDERRIEPGAIGERLERLGGEVDGVPVAQLAVALPQRGPDGVDDHRGRHGVPRSLGGPSGPVCLDDRGGTMHRRRRQGGRSWRGHRSRRSRRPAKAARPRRVPGDGGRPPRHGGPAVHRRCRLRARGRSGPTRSTASGPSRRPPGCGRGASGPEIG